MEFLENVHRIQQRSVLHTRCRLVAQSKMWIDTSTLLHVHSAQSSSWDHKIGWSRSLNLIYRQRSTAETSPKVNRKYLSSYSQSADRYTSKPQSAARKKPYGKHNEGSQQRACTSGAGRPNFLASRVYNMHKELAATVTKICMRKVSDHNKRTNTVQPNVSVRHFVLVPRPKTTGHKVVFYGFDRAAMSALRVL